MEAVERQAAALPALPISRLSPQELLGSFDLGGREPPASGTEIDAVPGVDLLSGNAIDVPLAWVQFPWLGKSLVFGSSTNGLAAGNSLPEAVYHAVCELLERHLWAIAHAQGYLRPRAIISRFTGGTRSNPVFIDDEAAFEIESPTGFAVVDELAERIRRAGLALRLRAVEREPFPLLVLATIADHAGGPAAAHTGHGCSLSPEHAAVRALSEAAQSRAVDFLAAREDHWRHDEPTLPPYGMRRTFGVPYGRWHYDAPSPQRTLRSFPDRSTSDIAGDVALVATALRAAGAGPVAVVDLSPEGLPVHVVRAVAPRLETPAAGRHFGSAVRTILDLNLTHDAVRRAF